MDKKLTMLIVDDIEINRVILKAVFTKKYHVLEAEDGMDAMEVLQQNDAVDVILLDLVMPRMDGMTFLKWLKAQVLYQHIPVIITTQQGESEKEYKALEMGAEDFVVKPYQPSIVERRVENVIAKCIWERRRLLDTAEKLNNILEMLPGGVISFYLQDQVKAGSFNRGFHELLGYEREELELLLKADPLQVVDKEHREEFEEALREISEARETLQKILPMVCKDGSRIWVKVVSKNNRDSAEDVVILSVFLNITEEVEIRKRMEDAFSKLQYRVERDMLTGCYNREAFYRMSKEVMEKNPKEAYAIAVIDIDRFKVLNELFGSSAGDTVLKKTAGFLGSLISGDSILARMESDKFALCLRKEKLERHQEEMEQFLRNGLKCQPVSYTIMAHVGIYEPGERVIAVERMYDRANLALQTIKNNYIRRIVYYDEELTSYLLDEQEIINEMEQALLEHQFFVQLQPIVDSNTGEIISAEALVRWRHPRKGVISPAEFIPIFEKNGFISQLDAYVWEEVAKYLKMNQDRGIENVPISVNVSRINFYQGHLCDIFTQLVNKYGVAPKYMKIEITESAYIENAQQLLKDMEQLKKAGFQVMMDDFGSGYSSLNMLKNVPVDILKIDMKFIDDIEHSQRACNLLYNIIQMAKTLKMQTVTEGVETQKQYELLAGMGCDSIQGYYFSRPLQEENFTKRLIERGLHMPEKQADRKPCILIVDDEETNRAAIRSNLEAQYDILEARDGEEGFAILEENLTSIRLILLDIVMPKKNGFEMLEAMAEKQYMSNIPVIVVTAWGDKKNEIKALKRGALDVIVKPFEPIILKKRVENLLRLYENESAGKQLQVMQQERKEQQKKEELLESSETGVIRLRFQMIPEVVLAEVCYCNSWFRSLHEVESLQSMEQLAFMEGLTESIRRKKTHYQTIYLNQSVQGRQTLLQTCTIHYDKNQAVVDLLEMQVEGSSIVGNQSAELLLSALRDVCENVVNYDLVEDVLEYENVKGFQREVCRIEHARARMAKNPALFTEERERMEEILERLFAGEKKVTAILHMKRLDWNHEPMGIDCWNKILFHTIFNENGEPVRAIGAVKDITAEREKELQKNKGRKKSKRNYIYAKIDLFQDELLEVDTAEESISLLKPGKSYQKWIHYMLEHYVHDSDKQNYQQELKNENLIQRYREGEREIRFEFRSSSPRKEKTQWYTSSMYLMENEANHHIYGEWQVMNSQKEKEKMLNMQRKAELDSLTEVYNRSTFEDRVDAILEDTGRGHKLWAFIMLDVDDFKQVNDTRGHEFGDIVLKAVTGVMRQTFRENDLVGRIGGDEFAIFMPVLEKKELAAARAGKLLENIQQLFRESEEGMKISCSIGIAYGPESGRDFQNLYRNADEALYRAKKSGKNQYCIYCQ